MFISRLFRFIFFEPFLMMGHWSHTKTTEEGQPLWLPDGSHVFSVLYSLGLLGLLSSLVQNGWITECHCFTTQSCSWSVRIYDHSRMILRGHRVLSWVSRKEAADCLEVVAWLAAGGAMAECRREMPPQRRWIKAAFSLHTSSESKPRGRIPGERPSRSHGDQYVHSDQWQFVPGLTKLHRWPFSEAQWCGTGNFHGLQAGGWYLALAFLPTGLARAL